MKITRAIGAGNSFFIVNDFENKFSNDDISELAKKYCTNKFFNFETDGLFAIKKKEGFDFEWVFFNKDGSTAEMCGNAARCAIKYFSQEFGTNGKVQFLAGEVAITGSVLSDDKVEVNLRQAKDHKNLKNLLGVSGLFVDTGVPHFVIEGKRNFDLARKLRNDPQFFPRGTNVTFIESSYNNTLVAVTYERGVEDFTLACGTGALAAAEWLRTTEKNIDQVLVSMPGGGLEVSWIAEEVKLRGPAKLQFTLEGERINEF